MEFEICKKKTKCSECSIDMHKDEVRGVYGTRAFYDVDNPFRYKCLRCALKKSDEINIPSLIRAYKLVIKLHNARIKKLQRVQIQLRGIKR